MTAGWSLPSHPLPSSRKAAAASQQSGLVASLIIMNSSNIDIYDRQHGIHPRSDNVGSATTIEDAFEDLALITKVIERTR
jgi:hypothetical protein